MAALDHLLAKIGDCGFVECPRTSDWQRAQAEFGFEFPSDYQALVSRVGTGFFGRGLVLRNPAATSQYAKLDRQAVADVGKLIEEYPEPMEVSFFPTPGGLVSIGGFDRIAFFLSEPSCLTIYIDLDDMKVHPTNLGITALLEELSSSRNAEPWMRELGQHIWPKDRPFFTPSRPASA